jgi:hypothetical protein
MNTKPKKEETEMMGICDTYYGGFRTRTFADLFGNVDAFTETYEMMPFPNRLAEENTISTIYYLLYARYGNSHIAFSDENQFIYALFAEIFQYAPNWEKKLDVQDKVRSLTEEDLIRGGKAIYNHAYNPGTAPSTGTLEELPAINDQNTTSYKKSKMDAYSMLLDLMRADPTEEFIGKFKKLFIQVLAPDYPLLYETYEEN